MSSRIDGTRIARVPVQGDTAPAAPRGHGHGHGEGARVGRGPPAEVGSAFESTTRPTSTPQARSSLGAESRAPVRTVAELLPPGLDALEGQEPVAHRFASDAALLAPQVRPSSLPSSERVSRLWSFFAAYAEAAAGHPSQPEAREVFREALDDQGFAAFRDAGTGEDGVTVALWVLDAGGPEEARERAEAVHLEPPPEVLHSEAAVAPKPRPETAPAHPEARAATPDAARSPESGHAGQDAGVDSPTEHPPAEGAGMRPVSGPAAGPLAADALRGAAVPVALERREGPDGEPSPEDPLHRKGTGRRLGPMMLWNVLHRFRGDPEDGAVAQGKWDRVAFGAVLALVGIALLAAALISSL